MSEAIANNLIPLFNGMFNELDLMSDEQVETVADNLYDNHRLQRIADSCILRSILVIEDDEAFEQLFLIAEPQSALELAQNYEVNLVRFARTVLSMDAAAIESTFRVMYSAIDASKKNYPLIVLSNRYAELRGEMAVPNLFVNHSRHNAFCTIL